MKGKEREGMKTNTERYQREKKRESRKNERVMRMGEGRQIQDRESK